MMPEIEVKQHGL